MPYSKLNLERSAEVIIKSWESVNGTGNMVDGGAVFQLCRSVEGLLLTRLARIDFLVFLHAVVM